MRPSVVPRRQARLVRLRLIFAIILVLTAACFVAGLILQNLAIIVAGAVAAGIMVFIGLILVTPLRARTGVGVVSGSRTVFRDASNAAERLRVGPRKAGIERQDRIRE